MSATRMSELRADKNIEDSINPSLINHNIKEEILSEANTEALRTIKDRAVALCIRHNIDLRDNSNSVVQLIAECKEVISEYAGSSDESCNRKIEGYIKEKSIVLEKLIAEFE